jgi:hypothetical protein
VLRALQHPFADWSTDDRYGPDDAISPEALERHREAARRLLGGLGLAGIRQQ